MRPDCDWKAFTAAHAARRPQSDREAVVRGSHSRKACLIRKYIPTSTNKSVHIRDAEFKDGPGCQGPVARYVFMQEVGFSGEPKVVLG